MSTVPFEGFREGCPGIYKKRVPGLVGPEDQEPTYYVRDYVQFQRDGRTLGGNEAGTVQPDAIRVTPVDDYESSEYRDRVYAFTDEVADAQRSLNDPRIPEGKVFTIVPSRLRHLEESCTDCRVHADECPLLARMMQLVIIAEVPF